MVGRKQLCGGQCWQNGEWYPSHCQICSILGSYCPHWSRFNNQNECTAKTSRIYGHRWWHMSLYLLNVAQPTAMGMTSQHSSHRPTVRHASIRSQIELLPSQPMRRISLRLPLASRNKSTRETMRSVFQLLNSLVTRHHKKTNETCQRTFQTTNEKETRLSP